MHFFLGALKVNAHADLSRGSPARIQDFSSRGGGGVQVKIFKINFTDRTNKIMDIK